MHVADGLLPAPLCLGGYALGGLTLWWTLKQSQVQTQIHTKNHARTEPRSPNAPAVIPHSNPRQVTPRQVTQQNIARAALLTAAFFVASSIRITIPPTSVHFILVGLMGAILGPLAFPAVVVGLTLQAVLVGHGGLTVLGVNALILGWPALVASVLFRTCQRGLGRWVGRSRSNLAGGFLAGCSGTALAVALFFGLVLLGMTPDLNAEVERAATVAIVIAHGPLVLIEGFFTAAVIGFCQRVYPTLLPVAPLPPRRSPQGPRPDPSINPSIN